MTALLWFAFLVVMAAIYQRLTGWITRFSIFTVFFVALFVRYGITVPFDNDITKKLAGLTMPPSALTSYYIALVMVYVTIAATLASLKLVPYLSSKADGSTGIGAIGRILLMLASVVRGQVTRMRGSATSWRSGSQPEVTGPALDASANGTVLALLLLAVSAIVLLTWVILPWKDFQSGLRFFISLHHLGTDYATHRAQYGQASGPGSSMVTYVGSFLRFAVLPPLVWIGLFHLKRMRWLTPIVAFALGLLALVGFATGQKEPALDLGVGIALAFVLRSPRPSLFNWRVAALVAVGLFVVIPILYHVQYPTLDYQQLVAQTWLRLTDVYSFNAQLRFLVYPNIHPFLYGASSLYVETALSLLHVNVSGLTPPETYIPSVVLGSSYTTGSWNTAFFAEAWADFGFVGCFVESVVVALLLAAVDRWYVNSERGPITQGTYVALLISTIYFTDVALSTALWTYGFLPAVILWWLLRKLSSVPGAGPMLRIARRSPTTRHMERSQPSDPPSHSQ